jgi:predicted phage terminase large subunit-like protein
LLSGPATSSPPNGDLKSLDGAGRDKLIDIYQHYHSVSNEILRRAIIEHNRIDLLATEVLGYQVQPFHLKMLQFQFQHHQSLQLSYRGAGKSTLCTVTKAIHYLLKNPNLRILLASKDIGNDKTFLREIKAQLENNSRLIEIFGEQYDPRKVTKWDETEIEILPRTSTAKEPSICCASPDSGLTSRHVDVILTDDLVVEENSRTKSARERVKTWYYQTLVPCLEPPDNEVEHRGEHHRLGTRYHYDELYGHLIENELKEHHQVIPGQDEDGRSPWPEKHTPEWFEEKKRIMGVILYNAQYLCDTEAMKGEVFQYDDCQEIEDSEIPDGLKIYQGNDLAVSEKATRDNAQYANVTIGEDKAGNIYVLDYFLGHISFPKQIDLGLKMYDKHDPIRAGVESNAYQKAFYQQVKHLDKDRRFVPINTDQDKMTRALKLTPMFEAKRVFFRKNMQTLIDQFVLFPGYRYRDGLDAFDLADRARRKPRRRKVRETEPGLL